MAKRKAPKFSERESTASKAVTTSVSLQELASPVAAVVNLVAVFAQEFSPIRAASGIPSPDKTALDMVVKVDNVEQADDDGMLTVGILFVLRAYEATEKAHQEQPRLEIKCKMIVMYHLPSFDGLSKESIVAFAKTSGVFSAWPYWREFVHSSSLRMSVDPIVLPTYHR
jgi:hypothetical protein